MTPPRPKLSATIALAQALALYLVINSQPEPKK